MQSNANSIYYLAHDKSIIFNLTKDYFELQKKSLDYKFKELLNLQTNFAVQDINYIIVKKTFQSVEKPFGLVDPNINIGDIEIDKNRIENFNFEIKKSLKMIYKSNLFKKLIENSILYFVPLVENSVVQKFRDNGSGCSMHWIKGSVFLSIPYNEKTRTFELALNIIHELGHQNFMIYQDIDEVIPNGLKNFVYSSVRKTERPVILSFHALVAIYYMYVFVIEMLDVEFDSQARGYLNLRLKELKMQFIQGAFALKNTVWTELGKNLFNEMINGFEKLNESTKLV